MDYEFHIQDPTSADTIYLFEAMIEASEEATSWQGIFAFASGLGVDSLIGDHQTQHFLQQSTISLIVGIDAVTNRKALERLRDLEREHNHLSVRVFWNPTGALFHPKIARFKYPDGTRTVIVGSGNLTPGGLRKNFEAFSIIRAAANEPLDLSSWQRFEREHSGQLRAIDDEVLERADRNLVRGSRQSGVAMSPSTLALGDSEHPADFEVPIGRTDRFLVAQVPRAGDRWHQIHFNAEVIKQFFRIRPNTAQRVSLMECGHDGSFGEEKMRPCVYSEANKNHKIEVASHLGTPYPEQGRPVIVCRELQLRSFAYMLLMPGEPGHSEMLNLTKILPSVGQGASRCITESVRIRGAWPACPLITAIDALPERSPTSA